MLALFTLPVGSTATSVKQQAKESYVFDVAFDSATKPAVPEEPIAIAYGFAKWEGDAFKGKGQDVLRLKVGDRFSFNIFDTARNPAPIAEILISFEAKPNAKGNSPFGDAAEIRLSGTNIINTQNRVVSAGCNVVGTLWTTTAFVTRNTGRYKFTITVKLADGTYFRTDPEVDVMEV